MALERAKAQRFPKHRRRSLQAIRTKHRRYATAGATAFPLAITEPSEQVLMQFALDVIHAPIVVTDLQGRVVRCNRAYERITGYTSDETQDKYLQDFVPAHEQDLVRNIFDKLRNAHSSYEYISHLITKDGRHRLIAWSNAALATPDKRGGYIVCTGLDITERERAEEQVRFHTHLLDAVEQAITVSTLDGSIVYQNRFADELYGWSIAESLAAYYSGESREQIRDPNRVKELEIIARVATGEHWSGEMLVHRWDNTTFPALVTASPVQNHKGELIGIVSSSIDITSQKQTELRLQYYIKRLENLRDIERAILAVQSPQSVAEAAISRIGLLVPYQWADVAVFDLKARQAHLLAVQSKNKTSFEVGTLLSLDAFGVTQEFHTGKLHIVEDIQNITQPEYVTQILKTEGVRTYIQVPLIAHGELVGSLNLGADVQGSFTSEHLDIAQEVANLVAIAIHNAKLFEEVKQYAIEVKQYADVLEERVTERTAALMKTNELLNRQVKEREEAEIAERQQRTLAESLHQIAHILNSTLNLDEVLERILDTVGHVVPHQAANIMFIETDNVRVVRCHGYDQYPHGDTLFNRELPLAKVPILQQSATTGETIVISDTLNHPSWVSFPGAEWVRSYASVPILLESSIIGFLNVDSATPHFFRPDHAERLRIFADQAAIAIQNARLYEQSQTLAALEERQRLSHELHDAVSQTLWSASLIADILPDLWEQNPEKGRQKLVRLRQLTRGALAEMRTLLLELHPRALLEVSFTDLLQRLCDVATSRTGIAVMPEIVGQMVLPPDVQVTLYRIAQEALSNIARHATASQITVTLHCDPDQFELQIKDNGRGFASSHFGPTHMGLEIMRNRARSINASLTINSELGQGTEVFVMWSPKKE